MLVYQRACYKVTKWGTSFPPKLSSRGLKARPGHRFVAADDCSARPTGSVVPGGELGNSSKSAKMDGFVGKSMEMVWDKPWICGK